MYSIGKNNVMAQPMQAYQSCLHIIRMDAAQDYS